ncbi:uncharacterized protein LOC125722457 isoform X2 [Brienomyrus brachyistius]|uniref:uncharacterized protein LOC125722457 isoform X2 n=1 Tax=Brienomyrus brachyistius TaxID=42636 RepID=UPI0020B285A5|nr:uncharacterized protein LOC125722457 isoform X2 [Brienomyrus brachyistius]
MFDFKWSSRTWCIDASIEDGSFGRLVNDDHRNPNCRMKVIKVDGRPHLCLFALRDIKEGEEITYDYGTNDWPWREKVYSHLTNDTTADKTDKDSGETNQMVTDEDDRSVTSDSAGQQHLTNDTTADKADKDSGETNQMVTDEDDRSVTSDSAGQQVWNLRQTVREMLLKLWITDVTLLSSMRSQRPASRPMKNLISWMSHQLE